MSRSVTAIVLASSLLLVAGGCGTQSSSRKPSQTGVEQAPTTVSSPTTTLEQPTPDAPPPVVGSNGAKVVFLTKTSGKLEPRSAAQSDSIAITSNGGTLFRAEHTSGVGVYGSVDADAFPLLQTRPNWKLTRLSADRMWSPGACAGVPVEILSDRWVVTQEILDGQPGDWGEDFNFGVRVYDRDTQQFLTLTPILPEPVRWSDLTAIGPETIQVTLYRGMDSDQPIVQRTINLATMRFTDAPPSPPTEEPPPPWTISGEVGLGSAIVLTSSISRQSITLQNINTGIINPVRDDLAFVAYANLVLQPSKIADQGALWNLATNDWDRVFETGTAPATTPRPVPNNNGLEGFPVWFAGASTR